MYQYAERLVRALCLFAVLGNFVVTPAWALDPAEANQEAKHNLEYMFQKIADKIAILLEKEPEFLPFGAGMDVNGKVQFVWTDKKQKYTAKGAMFLVRKALIENARAGRLMAVGTIYRYAYKGKDGKLKEQITVEMEYANGYAFARAIELKTVNGKKVTGKAGDKPFPPKIFTPEVVAKLMGEGHKAANSK